MQKNALCGRSTPVVNRYVIKTLLVMKLTIILLTVAIVQVSAKGLSQTVSFNAKNTPLREVLSAVEKQTGFVVACNETLLVQSNPVSISANNLPLNDFLQEVFQHQQLDFSIKNTTIFISRKTNQLQTVNKNLSADILQPPGAMQGRVINENGEPLAGANIIIKGTNQGATTDNNGYYKIDNIAAGTYILEISFVGYATKTSTIKVSENKAAVLNLTLTHSLVNLDQLTVTSTLSARKIRAYPVTIAVINQEDLKNRNINNIADVLESIPGIIVQPEFEGNNKGNSRQPTGILIRGIGAIGDQIKYLVDGVEVVATGASSFLQTMDPNNIEKIEVLKGPMASTLYGNGAASGIISITTKKGKSGKTRAYFKTMFTQYANEFANYSGYNQNYSMNVSGGNEQFNYLLGAAYNLYPTTKLTDTSNGINDKTWSYNVRIGGKVKNIAADLSLQYGNERSGYGSIAISTNKYLESLGIVPYPVSPIYDIRSSQRNFLTNLHLTHTITSNFYQDITIGYNITNSSSNYYTADYTGAYPNNENLYSKITARYFVFYDHSWSQKLKSSITAGFEYVGYETRIMNFYSMNPLTNFFTFSTPATAGSATFQKSPYSSTGYFAEIVTSFQNNLFLTSGIRYDVNNGYGEKVDGYAQPRVGLSYVIESAAFKIKPRIVWGVSSLAPDPTYKTTSINNYSYATIINLGNSGIKPQRSEGYEFGADLFYGSNYSLNITYYDQKIKDMIWASSNFDFTTSPPTYTFYRYNIGGAINKGLEVSAKAVLDPFVIDLSYTESSSKWGKNIGQASTDIIYPGATLTAIPKRSSLVRLTYLIPSFLPFTAKGGKVTIDWRYNGSAYDVDAVSYYIATDAWNSTPDPKPDYPNYDSYYKWQKGYSLFNLRADYSVTNYAAFYIDIQNILDRQGSVNSQILSQFPGRRFNFGFNINL